MPEAQDIIFYDGHCGLCQAWVKFLLRRDREGGRFRFAPLDGSTFQEALSDSQRDGLPDSVVVRTQAGEVLSQSTAVAYLMGRLGGGWRVLAGLFRVIPRPVRDLGYRGVARVRRRLWAAPDEACPLAPPEWRDRFLP